MKKLVSFSLPFPVKVKWAGNLFCSYNICLIVFFILIASKSFSQLPDANSCTSKDLELVGASLPAPPADPCACGGTRTLMLTINNKTGSLRTSFALWGTLEVYDSKGVIKTSEPIFACASPIPQSAITTLTSSKTITFVCGESLIIKDLFLAWTTSNKKETCGVLEANQSLISPKCGTLPEIRVVAGVDADFSITDATCLATGSIKVSPFGGVGPYTVAVGNDSRNVAIGASTTFNLPAGNYTILITDSRSCSVTKTRTIKSPAGVTAYAGEDFTKTCTTNTSGGTIGEAAASGFSYSWTSVPIGFSSTDANPTVNPSETTKYIVRKTNISSGCFDDDDVTVTVDIAAVTAYAGSDFIKTCSAYTSGGTIGEVAVSGFSYSWTSVPAGFSSTDANPTVNPSETTKYIVRKTNISSGCYDDDDVIVTVDNAILDAPTICMVEPTLCGPSTGSITILSPLGADYQYSIDNGSTWQTSASFDKLTAGCVTGIKVKKLSTGCESGAANCSSSDCSGVATLKSGTIKEVVKSATGKEVVKSEILVKAYPNPFSNEVKFEVTIPEAGNGSLELINMTGQKVKTVYQGYMNAGINNYEVTLPVKQSATLIYMLRVGDKQLTGKLLQISK